MRLAVQRFDPLQHQKPHWAIYDVPLTGRQTVLDGLVYIAEELDPTLAFRRMCRSGVCGVCGALVNGRAVLTCQTLAGEAVAHSGKQMTESDEETTRGQAATLEGPAAGDDGVPPADLVIQPLSHFRVLKDLVVDMDPFLAALERLHAWVVPRAGYDGRMSREVAQKLWGVAPCVLCGICASAPDAPGIDEMVTTVASNPAAVARALRVAFDPRDELGLLRLRVFRELGVLVPQMARTLREACPKDVNLEPLLADLASAGTASH